MSELEERLQTLLSNPEELSRVAEMAKSLMGESAPEEAPDRNGLSDAVQRLMQGAGGSGEKKQLLRALSPYLDEGRRRRLSRALRTASAAHLALRLLSERGADDGV